MFSNGMFQPGYANNFGSPTNFGGYGVDPSQAGWNLNASYMTPAYMAGYRPSYSGDQNFPMPNFGLMRGLNYAIPSPLQPEAPFYMSPSQLREQAMTGTYNKMSDASATAIQFLGGAAISAAVTGAMMSRALAAPMNAAGRFVGGMAGRAVGGAAGAAVGGGLGIIGGSLGMGSITGGIAGGASMGAAAGGALGGFIGSPLMRFGGAVGIGLAAGEVFNQNVMASYTAIRQGQETIRENLRGMAGYGSANSPMSISPAYARSIGTSLTKEFSLDLGFKPGAGAEIFQYGSQAGLYKDLGNFNPQAVRKKTADIAKQLKMVMDVFNEPSMQDAIGMIGQLVQTGGAGGKNLTNTLMGYKYAQAMTGVGSQQLFNTVGMQGQQIFQSAGLTPYLGQQAALGFYSGMANARRSGLISNEALAMMGGIEGSTQRMVTTMAGLSQTTYNRISALNQNIFGGIGGGGINSNLSAFGGKMAGDPMSAIGKMILSGDAAVSKQMKENPISPLAQIRQIMDVLPGARRADGKYDVTKAAGILSAQGMSNQDIQNVVLQLRSMQDPSYLSNVRRGIGSANLESLGSELEREGLSQSGIFHVEHAMKRTGAFLQRASAGAFDPVMGYLGSIGHSIGQSISSPVARNSRDMFGGDKSMFSAKNWMDKRDLRAARTMMAANRMVNGETFLDRFGGTMSILGNTAASVFYSSDNEDIVAANQAFNKFSTDPKSKDRFTSLYYKAVGGTLKPSEEEEFKSLTGKDSVDDAIAVGHLLTSSAHFKDKEAFESAMAKGGAAKDAYITGKANEMLSVSGMGVSLDKLTAEERKRFIEFSSKTYSSTADKYKDIETNKDMQAIYKKLGKGAEVEAVMKGGKESSKAMDTLLGIRRQVGLAAANPDVAATDRYSMLSESAADVVRAQSAAGNALYSQAMEMAKEAKGKWYNLDDSPISVEEIEGNVKKLEEQAAEAAKTPEGKMNLAADKMLQAAQMLSGGGGKPLSSGRAW